MITQTRQKILTLINNKGKMRVHDLIDELRISAAAIHRQLLKLLQSGQIIKIGSAPYVHYSSSEEQKTSTKNTSKHISDIVIPILLKYGVKKAALFGSYAKGDYDEMSDVDILIEPPSQMGLTFIDLKHNLEDALQKKVDLVSYNGISKYLKSHILAGQIPLI